MCARILATRCRESSLWSGALVSRAVRNVMMLCVVWFRLRVSCQLRWHRRKKQHIRRDRIRFPACNCTSDIALFATEMI